MNSTDKVIFGIVAVFTILIFVFIIGSSLKSSSASDLTPNDVIGAEPNVKGNPDAKVTLVEFSDFECPACHTFYPIVKEIADKYSNDLKVVYRHFPLTMHPRAIPTARAAEAAANQGKFWEYHNELFDNFPDYTDAQITKYAQDIGLDMDKFNQDLNSDDVVKKINDDLAAGEKTGLSGTPTFYIVVEDKVTKVTVNQYEDLEAAVKSAIEEVSNE